MGVDMAVVEISKDGPSFNKKVNTGMDKVDSLASLNIVTEDYKYDFSADSAGMNKGKIKTEQTIARALILSTLKIISKILVLSIISFIVMKYTGFEFTYFTKKMYTKSLFNQDFLILSGIVLGALFLVCFMLKIFINGTIKSCFKDRYLNKINMYVYYGYVVVVNIILYVCVVYLFFSITNHFYAELEVLKEAKRIVAEVNINIMDLLKYGIVILDSIFLALNALRGMAIVHKRNKFVLEEEF